MTNHERPPLVDLARSLPPLLRTMAEPAVRRVERLLALDRLNGVYAEIARRCREEGRSFWNVGTEVLGLRVRIPARELVCVPTSGPALVVANHPFGAPEAVALMGVLQSVRPDVRVLGNRLLHRMPEVAHEVIPVDVWGGGAAAALNSRAVRDALRWLARGGMLVVFPAGAVSHLHLRTMTVTDPEWNPMAAALALRARAPVVPVHIVGRNRWSFQLAGLVHPVLRTLLLARELDARRGRECRIIIGRPVAPGQLGACGDAAAATAWLRLQVYALQARAGEAAPRPALAAAAPLAAEEPGEDLVREVEGLGPREFLLRQGDWEVFAATAPRIPRVCREIARLRELTFRTVGEGTGQAEDWDRFDPHYLHLFLWDRAGRRVAGAYRIGRADYLVEEMGLRGLYTRSLFRYGRPFIRELGHALELGRSFIRPECQRHAAPLALLWRGIGEWVARHPRYHTLFGPVSISQEYHEMSRHLLVQFLRGPGGRHRGRGTQVHATRPPRPVWTPGLGLGRPAARLGSIEQVSAVIAQIEEDGKGVPVLLRHYLKMHARLVAFNVDPDFANALDGLVVVDLRKTEDRLVRRFLGDEGWARFRRFHESAAVGIRAGAETGQEPVRRARTASASISSTGTV